MKTRRNTRRKETGRHLGIFFLRSFSSSSSWERCRWFCVISGNSLVNLCKLLLVEVAQGLGRGQFHCYKRWPTPNQVALFNSVLRPGPERPVKKFPFFNSSQSWFLLFSSCPFSLGFDWRNYHPNSFPISFQKFQIPLPTLLSRRPNNEAINLQMTVLISDSRLMRVYFLLLTNEWWVLDNFFFLMFCFTGV